MQSTHPPGTTHVPHYASRTRAVSDAAESTTWHFSVIGTVLFVLILLMVTPLAAHPLTGAASDIEIEPAADTPTVSRVLDYEAEVTRNGIGLRVAGIALDDVRRILWNGTPIEALLPGALDDGRLVIEEADGALVLHLMAGSGLPSLGEGQLTVELVSGLAVTIPMAFDAVAAEPTLAQSIAKATVAAFPVLTCPQNTFMKPTSLPKTSGCGFGSTSCGAPGKHHTGIDYAGKGDVVAPFDGVVVRVEAKSLSDHGMGNNVILSHKVKDCLALASTYTIYSSYSHLASYAVKVGAAVKRGQKLGVSGGTGYGSSTYFRDHAHVEVKQGSVTGNPIGVSGTTCASKNTCWGYTPSDPKKFGHIDPRTLGL